jgi:hypothetical protein
MKTKLERTYLSYRMAKVAIKLHQMRQYELMQLHDARLKLDCSIGVRIDLQDNKVWPRTHFRLFIEPALNQVGLTRQRLTW